MRICLECAQSVSPRGASNAIEKVKVESAAAERTDGKTSLSRVLFEATRMLVPPTTSAIEFFLNPSAREPLIIVRHNPVDFDVPFCIPCRASQEVHQLELDRKLRSRNVCFVAGRHGPWVNASSGLNRLHWPKPRKVSGFINVLF